MYQLFHDSDEPPTALKLPEQNGTKLFGSSPKEARQVTKFRRYLSKINKRDLNVLLTVATKMAKA
jgi:hypothetical protein